MKGQFLYQAEDIDSRAEEKKEPELHKGYSTMCGIKGGKLSGGQK